MFGIDDALIGAGVSAVAGAASAYASSRTAKKNRKANEALAEKQAKWNREQIDLQNQYNSPVAQSARLKAAGLNPALAYGGSPVVAGNQDSTPNIDYSSAMTSPAAYDPSGAINQTFQNSIGLAQMRNLESQTGKNNTESALNLEQLKWLPKEKQSLIMMNQAKTDEVYQNIENQKQTLQNLILQGKLSETELKSANLALEIASATQQDYIDQFRTQTRKERLAEKQMLNELAKFPKEMQLLASQIQNIQAATRLTHMQGNTEMFRQGNVAASTREIEATISKIASETSLNYEQVKYYAFKAVNQNVFSYISNSLHTLLGTEEKVKQNHSHYGGSR